MFSHTQVDQLQLRQILARSFLPSRLSDSKTFHLTCITAYSSTYLKMTLEETSTENCELVIKSLGGQVIRLRLSMRLLVHYTMPDFLAPACKS